MTKDEAAPRRRVALPPDKLHTGNVPLTLTEMACDALVELSERHRVAVPVIISAAAELGIYCMMSPDRNDHVVQLVAMMDKHMSAQDAAASSKKAGGNRPRTPVRKPAKESSQAEKRKKVVPAT
jgi:hypothetical protein